MAHSTTVVDLELLLAKSPRAALLPELQTRPVSELAETEHGAAILNWARKAPETTTIPETTYTRYRQFRRMGARAPYEGPYFKKRQLLAQEVMAAWLGNDDSRIDRLNDLIWSICEETTWVAPAHEKNVWTIDLFSAETAVNLAHVLELLGDRLPEEVRDRVRAEIKSRIMDLYLEHGSEYWWAAGRNNWTGVCAGSIGQTFLLLEDDVERQAQALALVLEQLERFIEHAFEEDGGCLEGIGYWNYGLIHYVGFAEMLRARTNGAIDLLSHEKLRAIAQYPMTVAMGPHVYASFADSHEHSAVRPFLAARLAERTGAVGLRGMIGGTTSWRLTTVLRNLTWWDGKPGAMPPLESVFLPVSGIARLVDESGGVALVLAAKAGHNGEPHNHNDVGSFILRVGEQTYLCDPGGGLYNKDYFGPKRYENVFANSYGHSVPRIGGQLQAPGAERRGTMERLEENSIRITFHGAYNVPGLEEAARVITVHNGRATLEDVFRFRGDGLEIEEAFITWRNVEVDGSAARVITGDGVLEIRAEQGTFAAERLEDACEANQKSGVLTRLTVNYPPSPKITARFTITFHPAK